MISFWGSRTLETVLEHDKKVASVRRLSSKLEVSSVLSEKNLYGVRLVLQGNPFKCNTPISFKLRRLIIKREQILGPISLFCPTGGVQFHLKIVFLAIALYRVFF